MEVFYENFWYLPEWFSASVIFARPDLSSISPARLWLRR
jgi:hypothetical protein